MKNDMRFTIPLWQMGAILFLIILTVSVGAAQMFSDLHKDGFRIEFHLESIYSFMMLGAFVGLIIYLIVFLLKIKQHNNKFPTKKINGFTMKPQEYIEDDEFFAEVTKRATQKVYSYYTWILPLFVGFCLGGGFGRTTILVGILLIAMGQYWIYYRTIRKIVKGLDEE